MGTLPVLDFDRGLHRKYLNGFLHHQIPSFLSNMDTNRSVILFFCVSGLEVLDDINETPQERKHEMIDWLYCLQVEDDFVGGFQGSTTVNTCINRGQGGPYKWGHIATTYSCLLSLLILGDNFERVNRKEIVKSLRALQLEDGSFKGAIEGAENDMRFVFCACSISYILNDWNGVDVEKMVDFILKSIVSLIIRKLFVKCWLKSYDGGIGQGPGLESHCGSTFCAIAALALSNNLHRLSKMQIGNLRRWLLFRFDIGFNGRPNKPSDTCYSFWTGGALKILNAYQFIESKENPGFVLMTQDKYGGFCKWVNSGTDPMHTYFGLAGLSLMRYDNLNEMFPALNCTKRTHDRLKSLHARWK
ncbi:geranylgeranyl transferase type-1 subunit beta isoform X1 [Euwallacea fornicatus]|uniref:geranylgeranyl transferase type-1 subunit beta isoform X1 n=2 Tax=Euwallacea fornicatus TaxID=995702 RepID=UPI00338E3CFE